MLRSASSGGFRFVRSVGFAALLLVLAAEFVWLEWPTQRSTATRVGSGGAVSASTAPTPDTTVVTTTTVAPTTSSVPAVSPPVTAPGSVTYTVAAGLEIRVVADGRCWMQARSQAGGPVLADTTLAPGDSKAFPAPVWLRFGDTSKIVVTAGSTALQLPAPTGDLVVQAR